MQCMCMCVRHNLRTHALLRYLLSFLVGGSKTKHSCIIHIHPALYTDRFYIATAAMLVQSFLLFSLICVKIVLLVMSMWLTQLHAKQELKCDCMEQSYKTTTETEYENKTTKQNMRIKVWLHVWNKAYFVSKACNVDRASSQIDKYKKDIMDWLNTCSQWHT